MLVKCRTCKKDVAKDAKVCPHCGQHDPHQMKVNTLAGCLLIVVGFLVVAWLVS